MHLGQIGKNTAPDPAASSPNWQQSPRPTPYSGKITFDGTWYISNNVPYAELFARLRQLSAFRT